MSYTFTPYSTLISCPNVAGTFVFTIAAWIRPTTAGGSNRGVIFSQGAGGGRAQFGVYDPGDGLRLRFHADYQTGPGGPLTTPGDWMGPAASMALGTWQHVGVAHDGSTAATDPLFYVNGALVATTETGTPTGQMSADPQPGYIGSRHDLYWGFDGQIGEVAAWNNRQLSPAAMRAVLLGALAIPDFTFYAPLDTDSLQEYRGQVLVRTGATRAENPPTRPGGRHR